MVNLGRGIFQTRPNVFQFKVWEVMKNFRFGCSTRKHIQHILNPNAQSANTRPAAALARIESDSIE